MRRSTSASGQVLAEGRGGDPPEGPTGTGAVEHGDLEEVRVELLRLTVGLGREDVDGEPQRLVETQSRAPAFLGDRAELFSLAAHDHEALLVRDGAVVGQPVDLVARLVDADLRHDKLDLERLGLRGEHGAERLGVGVRKRPRADVRPVVGVPAQVRVTHPCDPQVLELVVLADRGECDAVIDLGDLVQGARSVLGREGDAIGVSDDDDGAAASNALARKVRPVLHELFWRDVERHAHDEPPPRCPWSLRTVSRSPTTSRSTADGTWRTPVAVTVTTIGQICRMVSGPPVAASSSAASTRASTAVRTASSSPIPARQRFLSEPRAKTEPEPTA